MSEQKLGLFLDDERFPEKVYPNSDVKWQRAPTHWDFDAALEDCIERHGKFFEVVSFDYFLSLEFDDTEINGMLCLRQLISFCTVSDLPLPECKFHTSSEEHQKAMQDVYDYHKQRRVIVIREYTDLFRRVITAVVMQHTFEEHGKLLVDVICDDTNNTAAVKAAGELAIKVKFIRAGIGHHTITFYHNFLDEPMYAVSRRAEVAKLIGLDAVYLIENYDKKNYIDHPVEHIDGQ